jgi:DNA-binding response OmpR family regulator
MGSDVNMKYYKVLVIEDSIAFCKLINRKLHEYRIPIEVTLCHTYQAAKALLDEQHQMFDVAVVDLNLPDAPTGAAIELAHHWDISVLVFTVRFDDALRQSFIQQGVADYILKQGRYNLDYLGKSVHRLLLNPELTVLIVRSDKTSGEALAELTKTQRLNVQTAISGAEALALIEHAPDDYDIIIIDYALEDTRGDQLSVAIRHLENHDHIQILGVMDADNTSVAPAFLKAGVTDLISQPFEPEELYSRLGQIADNIEIVAELQRLNIEKKSFYRDGRS